MRTRTYTKEALHYNYPTFTNIEPLNQYPELTFPMH